jgi:hypothetical protein
MNNLWKLHLNVFNLLKVSKLSMRQKVRQQFIHKN